MTCDSEGHRLLLYSPSMKPLSSSSLTKLESANSSGFAPRALGSFSPNSRRTSLIPSRRRIGFGRHNRREELVAVLHGIGVVDPHVFRDDALAKFLLSLIDEDSLNQGPGESPDGIPPVFDEGSGSSDGGVRVGTARVRCLARLLRRALRASTVTGGWATSPATCPFCTAASLVG